MKTLSDNQIVITEQDSKVGALSTENVVLPANAKIATRPLRSLRPMKSMMRVKSLRPARIKVETKK